MCYNGQKFDISDYNIAKNCICINIENKID